MSATDSSAPSRRIQTTLSHLTPPSGDIHQQKTIGRAQAALTSASEKEGEEGIEQSKSVSNYSSQVKWNGWGFKDTSLDLDEDGEVFVTGNRYLFSGMSLPNFRSWVEEYVGIDINDAAISGTRNDIKLPSPVRNNAFLKRIETYLQRHKTRLVVTFAEDERLLHCHGHTMEDVWRLRHGGFERYPDVVFYPGSHEDVLEIVNAAHENNVVIIPYGGGTSVSGALECPGEEKRMIVSLDMHEMNEIKWINRQDMTACIQAGAIGRGIEEKLQVQNLTMGHEPDSSEFSSLGGWISTRASGMMKNKYGNIEDIICEITMVTPTGVIKKSCRGPRLSTGPDIYEMILGSEGTFGVITEAVVRVHDVPEVTKYGSIIFPDFETGVKCVQEIARKGFAPVSIRLVDNPQFQFGQALKPPVTSTTQKITDKLKKWYVTKGLRFDVNKMVAATLKFVGKSKDIKVQEANVYGIANKHGGKAAGEENGRRGYFLTFMIAYIRDFGLDYNFMAESFETSVPWTNVLTLCQKVKLELRKLCKSKGVAGEPFVSCRVTQTYHDGACVYFYFGFLTGGLDNPIHTFEQIENEARDAVIKCGGSLSHHHGVGKLRKRWLEDTISPTGINMLKAIKNGIDPKNIFANGNMFDL